MKGVSDLDQLMTPLPSIFLFNMNREECLIGDVSLFIRVAIYAYNAHFPCTIIMCTLCTVYARHALTINLRHLE